MTEFDDVSLIDPHPDHLGDRCVTCENPATEWGWPFCTACLIHYREMLASEEIESIRSRIAELEWNFNEAMLQYDIQQKRACDAEAHIAALEAENARLQRDYDSGIVQEVKRQIESRQGKCILVAQGTLELLIEERCEETKAALARLVEAGNAVAADYEAYKLDGTADYRPELLREWGAALDAAREVLET
jgi:hypothetical protein